MSVCTQGGRGCLTDPRSPYGKEQAVHILLECILVLTNSLYPAFPCTSLDTGFCLYGIHTIAARFRVFIVTGLSVKTGPNEKANSR